MKKLTVEAHPTIKPKEVESLADIGVMESLGHPSVAILVRLAATNIKHQCLKHRF